MRLPDRGHFPATGQPAQFGRERDGPLVHFRPPAGQAKEQAE